MFWRETASPVQVLVQTEVHWKKSVDKPAGNKQRVKIHFSEELITFVQDMRKDWSRGKSTKNEPWWTEGEFMWAATLFPPCCVLCRSVSHSHHTPHPRSVPPQLWNKTCEYCRVEISVLLLKSRTAGNIILIYKSIYKSNVFLFVFHSQSLTERASSLVRKSGIERSLQVL